MGWGQGADFEVCKPGEKGGPGKDLELDEDWVWDDVDDKELDVTKVREAKKEEISYMKPPGTWSDVDENQCRRMTEEPLVNVKWVDTDQKTEREPLIWSSLVARDVRDKGDKDRQVLFAATLPLEAKRQLNLLRAEAEAAHHRRQEGSLEPTVRPG